MLGKVKSLFSSSLKVDYTVEINECPLTVSSAAVAIWHTTDKGLQGSLETAPDVVKISPKSQYI